MFERDGSDLMCFVRFGMFLASVGHANRPFFKKRAFFKNVTRTSTNKHPSRFGQGSPILALYISICWCASFERDGLDFMFC